MVSAAAPISPAPSTPVAERIAALRQHMRTQGIDALVVRATDAYLNEYVPEDESLRAFITGFTGSMGDAVLTLDRAILFVDGRYTLQAEQEAPDFERVEVPLGRPIESAWIDFMPEIAKQGVRILGVETDRVPVSTMEELSARCQSCGIDIRPTLPSLIGGLRSELLGSKKPARGRIWTVDSSLSGRSVQKRLADAAPFFDKAGVDGFVVIPLDELAWIANLRGDHFPYQATFRAQAVVLRDQVLVAANPKALQKNHNSETEVQWVGEGGLVSAIKSRIRDGESLTLGYAASSTPESVRAALAGAGVRLVEMDSPFANMRTHKTPEELRHMAHAFARADDVVKKLQSWLSGGVSRGEAITEADVAAKVKQLFKRSGAWGLSFKVISAAGPHGAIIHYSKPDSQTPIREGEVYLLDTGGYYEGGYATDLTRTFLVGRGKVTASEEHRKIFTVVLKGAIAGMSARLPKGTLGEQLDAIVRDPIWRAGYNYAHGTGHGVGVNVHEFPPRVAPGVRWPLEVGHVFSIEPGIYLNGFGGVRIENLVTLVEDPEDENFMRIRPLTFSPFDTRLIEKSMLTPHEKSFLKWFADQAKVEDRLANALPPLS